MRRKRRPIATDGEKPLARETRFGLIYALSRARNARPTSIFEAPFVQLLMRPGHFIFTLWRAGARRGVVILPAVLPDPDRFVPAYANPMRKRRYSGRKSAAARGGNHARRDSFSIHLPARTIVGKIITVFTAERIPCRASEPAPRCKVDRQVSSTSASTLDEAESSLAFYDSTLRWTWLRTRRWKFYDYFFSKLIGQ